MLVNLHIENVAVIEQADIEFQQGLNVLTGETGAGKSIVIDSINAILGERMNRELIRTGASRARVGALFSSIPSQVMQKMEEAGVEAEEEDVYKRQMRGRADLARFPFDSGTASFPKKAAFRPERQAFKS